MSKKAIIDLHDGQGERELVLTVNALDAIYEATGENPLEGDFWKKMSPKKVKAVVYCGLRDKTGLTLETVGDRLTVRDMQGLGQLFASLLAEPDPEQENPSTGSGPSAA